jgi:hypothetical protein
MLPYFALTVQESSSIPCPFFIRVFLASGGFSRYAFPHAALSLPAGKTGGYFPARPTAEASFDADKMAARNPFNGFIRWF